MAGVVKLSFTDVSQITPEVNDALNLWGMWGAVEQGLMTREEWDAEMKKFEEKYPH